MDNYNSQLYTVRESDINGHGVWFYAIETPIGRVNVVEFEDAGQEIKRFLFDTIDAAEKKYSVLCKKALTLIPYNKK